MKETYTIKEFSKITNIPTDTLRYYDKINLFKPSFRDEGTGYRYYTLGEFEQIGVIQTLQQLGMTLQEIKDFENEKTFFLSYKLIKKQHAEIQEKIKDLTTVKHYLDDKIKVLDSIMTQSVTKQIIIKELPERSAYISDKNCKDYSQIKMESARIIENYSKNLFISSSFALHIPIQDLFDKKYKENYYCAILDIEKDENKKFTRIFYPEGKYVTIRYNGTSFERNKSVKELLNYIKNEKLTIIGDALQLCIVDENLTNLDNEKINEIQIPIK